MRKKLIFIAPLAIVGLALFVALGGVIVMQLWNWLLPTIFGWREVTFWQAIGMLALCRILFGGFGLHGSARSRVRERINDRCGNLTTEERERFRQRIRERFGFGPSTTESKPE
jgi:hypothetical protein